MPLKRSQAPSVLFASKKQKTDDDGEDVEIVKPTKKKGEEKRVNHLELYNPKKKDEKKENIASENDQDNAIVLAQGNKKGKNMRLTKTSSPLFYLVHWRSAKKFDDKQGHGT